MNVCKCMLLTLLHTSGWLSFLVLFISDLYLLSGVDITQSCDLCQKRFSRACQWETRASNRAWLHEGSISPDLRMWGRFFLQFWPRRVQRQVNQCEAGTWALKPKLWFTIRRKLWFSGLLGGIEGYWLLYMLFLNILFGANISIQELHNHICFLHCKDLFSHNFICFQKLDFFWCTSVLLLHCTDLLDFSKQTGLSYNQNESNRHIKNVQIPGSKNIIIRFKQSYKVLYCKVN